MYYEIYIENLLAVNFVMNWIGLELVNRICLRTATHRRIFLGAALGAVCYLIPFLIPGPGLLKLAILFPMGMLGMLGIVFRFDGLRAFARVLVLLLTVSFALGGAVIFLSRFWSNGAQRGMKSMWVAGSGVLLLAAGSLLLRKRPDEDICQVELIGKGARITVNALIDSGNGLLEPCSGRPVCIMEQEIFRNLWLTGGPEGMRMIPYRSVGKENGILYGFPVPLMTLHVKGMTLNCREVYVGVTKETLSSTGGYCMLVNPLLLEAEYRNGK